MIYLLLAILSSTAMAVVMRLSEGRVRYKLPMLATNYFVCLMCSWAVSGFGNPLPNQPGRGMAAGMGVVNGVFYVSALLLNQHNISTCGVILPSVFSKMGGMLIPLLASLLLFGETPTAIQAVGVVLSVISVIVLNYRKGEGGARGAFKLSLFGLLLTEGCVSAMSKVYKEWGNAALEPNYLLVTFIIALSVCVALVIARREKPGAKELIFGFFIGLPNFLCARFILRALESVPAVIVYPSRSIGTILMVTLAGVALFREKLSKRQIAAIVVILISLVLLNM